MATFQAVWGDRNLETAIVYAPPQIPAIMQIYMTVMGIIAFGTFSYDLYKWLSFNKSIKAEARA
jgi:hypothetical protein